MRLQVKKCTTADQLLMLWFALLVLSVLSCNGCATMGSSRPRGPTKQMTWEVEVMGLPPGVRIISGTATPVLGNDEKEYAGTVWGDHMIRFETRYEERSDGVDDSHFQFTIALGKTEPGFRGKCPTRVIVDDHPMRVNGRGNSRGGVCYSIVHFNND